MTRTTASALHDVDFHVFGRAFCTQLLAQLSRVAVSARAPLLVVRLAPNPTPETIGAGGKSDPASVFRSRLSRPRTSFASPATIFTPISTNHPHRSTPAPYQPPDFEASISGRRMAAWEAPGDLWLSPVGPIREIFWRHVAATRAAAAARNRLRRQSHGSLPCLARRTCRFLRLFARG